MSQLYRFHDYNKELQQKEGMVWVSPGQAKWYNQQGYGIFHAVNEFFSKRRTKEELCYINYWAVDIDNGTKDDQLKLIEASLRPSKVIESKNGFHVYYRCKSRKPCLDSYRDIVEYRLIPHFNADKRAKDVCRVLRTPDFLHWKDPNDPYKVKLLYSSDAAYTAEDMKLVFKNNKNNVRRFNRSVDKFKKDYPKFDNVEILKKLSGTNYVRGDVFDFKPQANGNWNIWVNNQSTSCFIDREGLIGSSDGGGPTVFQWLKWYGHSTYEASKILKQYE